MIGTVPRVAIPDFITDLRSRIGTDLLWLAGVTAVVHRPGQSTGADAGVARDDVLLVRRADNGWWTPVTGVIDPGEEPADAAVREVLEEAGVVAVAERIAWLHVLPPMTYENGDRAQYLDITIRCRWVSGDPYPVDGENTDARWYPVDQLPTMPGTHGERIARAMDGTGPAHFHGGGLPTT